MQKKRKPGKKTEKRGAQEKVTSYITGDSFLNSIDERKI